MNEEENTITTNHRRSLMVDAAFSHIQIIEEEESQWGGLSDGYKYIPRTREITDQ